MTDHSHDPGDLYIGIMTGTSLDGIDASLCRFRNGQLITGEGAIEILGAIADPFPESLRKILFTLATEEYISLDLLSRTHFLLSQLYSHAVTNLLGSTNTLAGSIRAIGLHGQTIRHLPIPERLGSDLDPVAATLQIGSGAALAALIGIDVVSDFRSADIAVGGESAPLVPMFDAIFLGNPSRNRILLNIGGIANLTYLPHSGDPSGIMAFDTGPGNMLIDLLTQEYFGRRYDDGGKLAGEGIVDEAFLVTLLEHSYFGTPPPKSTGRELFGAQFFEMFRTRIANGTFQPVDAIATASMLTVRGVMQGIAWIPNERNGLHPLEIVVSGGGALNDWILNQLRIESRADVISSDTIGIPTALKESIAFAFFAKAFLEDTMIHLPLTTGATHAVHLGSLSKG